MLYLYNICSTCRNRSDWWPQKILWLSWCHHESQRIFCGSLIRPVPTCWSDVPIRFQSSFTIRWELEDKNFHAIDIICLDDSLKYWITAIKTNENFTPFSNRVTFKKPWGTDLVTASELIPSFCRSKSNVRADPGVASHDQKPDKGDSLRHQIPAPCPHSPPLPPHGIYIDRCIICSLKWNPNNAPTTCKATRRFVYWSSLT